MVVASVIGVIAIRRLLESRNGLELNALGSVSRGWIASALRRTDIG
jgi:hypothetical protein